MGEVLLFFVVPLALSRPCELLVDIAACVKKDASLVAAEHLRASRLNRSAFFVCSRKLIGVVRV